MKYKKATLPNGLRLITIPTKGNPSVTVMVLVETGSRYEKKSQNGLSHFLEHMVFKGTKRRPSAGAISHELDSLGAASNAFTSQEMTGYWAKAEKRHFKQLLDITSDMYLNPTLSASELEKERGVILQEISMYEDLPQRKVWDVFYKLLYGETPLGRTILGPARNIRKFSRREFEAYRKLHYVAGKTIVIVAGDVSEAETLREVKKAFSNLPSGRGTRRESAKVSKRSSRLTIEQKKTDQTHLVLGFPGYSAKSSKSVEATLLGGILGAGMSSRLFQKLREEMGVCYYVRAGHEEATDTGFLAISTGVDRNRVEEVVKALLEEVKRLTEEEVSSEELTKAKDFLMGHMYMNLETSDGLAEFYAEQEVESGSPKTPFELEKELRKVGAKDIKKVAKEIFRTENIRLAVVGSVKNPSRLEKLLVI